MFTPHSVIFVGRDTHFVRNDNNYHFFRKNNLPVKFPQFREIYLQFRETWRSRAISGDSWKFRETWQVCDTTLMLPFVDYHLNLWLLLACAIIHHSFISRALFRHLRFACTHIHHRRLCPGYRYSVAPNGDGPLRWRQCRCRVENGPR